MQNLLLRKPSQNQDQRHKINDLHALETKRSCLETTNTTPAINKISKNFRCQVRRSTVHDTAKLLTNNMKNGILSIDENNS